jgi:uncharacterized membrane protein
MDKEHIVQLYGIFRTEMLDGYKLHSQTLQHYLAFVVIILGVTITGLLNIRADKWLYIVILCGPIINILICIVGMSTCRRFYLGALEKIVITKKLEKLLNLDEVLAARGHSDATPDLFPKDKYLLPRRWVEDMKQYSNSDEFVQKNLNAGVNRWAKVAFQIAIAINAALSVIIVVSIFVKF